MSTKTIHMCIDIAGCLRRISEGDKSLACAFTDEDGRPMITTVLLAQLQSLLDDGKRVMPMGEPCEGFSDETGCPGHPSIGEVPDATPACSSPAE